MANRFAMNEPKQIDAKEMKEMPAKKQEKYVVNVRFNGELEECIRQAAYRMGLPVTKYIELAVRHQLKEDGLL